MKFGEMLVIIGVAGELLGDGGIFLSSRHLQTIADQEIAVLTREAGDAKTSANSAADAAFRANNSADAAGVTAAIATSKVVGLEKDVARAKTQMSKQQERAANAERSLLELQERVKSRHLSPQQKEKIRAYLAKSPPETVDVWIFIGAEDGVRFGYDFVTTIESAGWKVGNQQLMPIGGETQGVALLNKGPTGEPKSAQTLRKALIESGIVVGGFMLPTLREGQVVLLISGKPN